MFTSSQSLQLSPLDLIPPKYYTRLALSFRTTETAECLLPKLQASLSETCQSIPWLGGKVVPTTDSTTQKPGLQVHWAENETPTVVNLGPLPGSYVEAAAASMPLTTIPDDKWPVPGRIDDHLHNAGAPVFAGGLLSFGDSQGVTLCVCVHHNVVDAGGIAEVLRIWASILCGMPAPVVVASDRAGRLSDALGSHLESASALPLESLLASHPEYTTAPLQFGGDFASCASAVSTVSLSKVDRLKAELGRYTIAAPTANTIICAVLWCALTRIRRRRNPALFPPKCKSRLGMAVNGRARIDPDFSSAKDPYFGNVNFYALAELQTHHLSASENLSAESLAHVCDAIAASNSAGKINTSHIAEVCSLVSRFDKFPSLFPAWSISSGLDLAVTGWANLGIYDMRFGGVLGHPEFVRVPYAELDSLAIVLPRKRAGVKEASENVIEVMLMLRRDDLESLQGDEVWKKLAV